MRAAQPFLGEEQFLCVKDFWSERSRLKAHDSLFSFNYLERNTCRGHRLLGEYDMRRDAPQNASPGRRNSLLGPMVCQDEEFFTLCKNVPKLTPTRLRRGLWRERRRN